MLPSDLRHAEFQAMEALRSALASNATGRWTVEWRFEGLRLMPVALRLAEALQGDDQPLRVLFPDAGATALARRDHSGLAPVIFSLSDHRRFQEQQAPQEASPQQGQGPLPLLILVAPTPADYDLVEALCGAHSGAVVLVNPTLEAGAVGIGSVARARRKGFLAQWEAAYALQPSPTSALRRAHPGEWELYRLDPDGFRLAASFPNKPSGEEQADALDGSGSSGLQQPIRALGELIDTLQS